MKSLIIVSVLYLFGTVCSLDQDIKELFQKKIRRYSNFSCDLAWTPEQGHHLVAIADIEKDQLLLKVPSQFVFHAWNEFPGKSYLREAAIKANMSIPQNLVLALRIKSAFDSSETHFDSKDDQHFIRSVLQYYSELQLDDMPLWTQEDMVYYAENVAGQALDRGKKDRQDKYEQLMQGFKLVEGAEQFAKAISNFTEINFWWSVVSTRNHQVYNHELQQIHSISDNDMNSLRNNNNFMSGNGMVNLLIPLIDLPNHHQPKNTNLTDFTKFTLHLSNTSVGVSTSTPIIKTDSEITYTYNPKYLDPFSLLNHYGFTSDNNPFATMLLTTPNYIAKIFNPNEKQMCTLINCAQNLKSNDQLTTYLLKREAIPQTDLMNIYRIKFVSKARDMDNEMLGYSIGRLQLKDRLNKENIFSVGNEIMSVMRQSQIRIV